MVVSPLRVPWPRLRLWALALFGLGIVPIIAAPFNGFHDWTAFWTAGRLVGTPDIVSAAATIEWQRARDLPLAVFPYPPAAGFLYWPFARLSIDWSFWLHAALMLACALGASAVGARVYGLPRRVALLAALAWAPLTGAIVIGQNTPFALLLAMVGVAGLAFRRELVAGSAVGALLYKPTLGLPLAGLLLIRGVWTALIVVIAAAALWYGLGVLATGGLFTWPREWLATLGPWLADDAVRNADKAVSLPGLLSRVGVPDAWALAVGGLLALAALPRLVRAPPAEAGAGALLVGVAASPHAWGYEAAMLLPILWWALAGGLAEPWRTRLVVGAFLVAPLWLVSLQTVVSSVAFIVLGAYVIWVAGLWRANGASVAAGARPSPGRYRPGG